MRLLGPQFLLSPFLRGISSQGVMMFLGGAMLHVTFSKRSRGFRKLISSSTRWVGRSKGKTRIQAGTLTIQGCSWPERLLGEGNFRAEGGGETERKS